MVEDSIARIEALEAAVAHQERTIEELNAVVAAQWTDIDALRREVDRLRRQLREVEANPALAQPEPPPPHY